MRRELLCLILPALVGACSRGAPVPDLAGSLADVIVHAGLHDAAAVAGPVQLDSLAFGRLGVAAGGEAYTSDELRRQIRRDVVMVHSDDVLECPSREPCRLRDGGTFLTVWDAVLTDDVLSVVVSRARNSDRLYTMTRHATFRLELRGGAGAWRLTGMEQIAP
jgi:hypothetical protein